MPALPSARGELSDLLLGRLIVPAHPIGPVDWSPPEDVLGDEDLQLALYLLYELHYRGFDEVDDRWEWEPSLLALRAELEEAFEAAVREVVGPELPGPAPEDTDRALRAVIDQDTGPSLSIHLARHGTREQMLEFLVHRSAYQLKEADPHSWALPRLSGPPKAALVEVQADEYGGGRPERIHAEMFAGTLRAAGLDPAYGAYLDHIPGLTLATVNLMSMMGLHRRLRAGIVGHLAAFEMTSAVPARRYADGLRRLGFGDDAAAFFDEHVEADAVHESIASVDLAGGLIRQDPAAGPLVLFGARALLEVEGRWGAAVMAAWEDGESSLRVPLEKRAPA